MLFQIKYLDSKINLDKDKLIIGNSDKADIIIDDKYISPFHAMLFIDHENQLLSIQDLSSQNGVFVNGIKITSNVDLLVGDVLSLGKSHLELEESVSDFKFNLENTPILETLTETKISLPPKDAANLTLIDDEYCDIVFDDKDIAAFNPDNFKFNYDNYIEPEEFEQPFEIHKENDELCLSVITSINGVILEHYHLPLYDQTIRFSAVPKKNHLLLETIDEKSIEAFKIVNGQIQFIENNAMTVQSNTLNNKSGTMLLSSGICQIHISYSKAPADLLNIPFWVRNKEFWKKTSTQTFGSFAVFLLLLLVDISIPEKPKKLSIIYKKPIQTEKKDQKLASKEKNKDKKAGHKKNDNKKKIAHRKKGVEQKKKPTKSKPTKVAKVQPKKLMKLQTNLASSLSATASKQVSINRSPSSVQSMSASSVADTSLANSAQLETGKAGLDSLGGAQSYGAKGMASKGPRDTAYVQTRTVVLGSMDPELLRKILEQYLPQFRHCYQQELAFNSDDIKGVVNLDFEINKIGQVGKVNILAQNAKFSNKGINCMSKVLSIISFPKPKGGGKVAVRQPLNFFAEQENS